MKGTYRALGIMGVLGLLGIVLELVLRILKLYASHVYQLPANYTYFHEAVVYYGRTYEILVVQNVGGLVFMASTVFAIVVAAQTRRNVWLVSFIVFVVLGPLVSPLLVGIAEHDLGLPRADVPLGVLMPLGYVFGVTLQLGIIVFTLTGLRRKVVAPSEPTTPIASAAASAVVESPLQ